MQEYQEKLRKSAAEEGYVLTDQEFERLFGYTVRKAEIIGKDEDYLPLLFKDVVKEYFFSVATLAAGIIRTGI